jgi:hypothetical protein
MGRVIITHGTATIMQTWQFTPQRQITGNGQSLVASRSVLPTARFSSAAQTELGLKNDLRSQAKALLERCTLNGDEILAAIMNAGRQVK